MHYKFTESSYEKAIIELFVEELGYDYRPGPDITRDYRKVVWESDLRSHLQRINSHAPKAAIDEAVRKIVVMDSPNLIENNKVFHDYLRSGVAVDYYKEGPQSTHIQLIDYEHVKLNEFVICNQYSVEDRELKRPDIVIFINGLPLIVMELKSCSREQADTSSAFKQIRNYLQAIPSLFTYNAFCVISDMSETKAGTITASEDRFMRWKSVDGSKEETRRIDFETLFKGMFNKKRLLKLLQNFILFLGDKDEEPVKILSAYHQFYAVNKAVGTTLQAVQSNGKAGVFWHTQGSGKSLSMVFYSAMLAQPLNNPTLVVLTDRNDLDDQLFGTFSKATDHLRQAPVQAQSRAHLKELLDGRAAGGIIFTTMQKFEEDTDVLSERRNIIMIADEAHRSQYGLHAKVDSASGRITYGMAKYVRDALPHASFIGFTGTPIDSTDRSTQEIFGDYIDVYDMTQSVEDEATRPIFYESRVMNLKLEQNILNKIDQEYENMAIEAEPHHIQRSKNELGKMEAILGAPETIEELCKDIVKHYEDRQHILSGKAMVVAYSRPIGMKIYKKLLEMHPTWQNKLAIVMSKDNRDPEEWFNIIPDKKDRDELATKFKDPDSELKICIVVDMWLTGFDIPCLNTMYIYKPMQGHTLMQAIARVNRVYKDKEGGLIVDYVGIASSLKQAMKDYTDRDKEHIGNNDIGESALPKFREKMEICSDLMHGVDLKPFFGNSDLERARCIANGIDHILAGEDKKKIYLRETTALKQAETLCRSLLSEKERILSAYFEAVRAGVSKVTGIGKITLRDINDRINELLKASIKSEGVVNVFANLPEFSIFDPEYLEKIKKMEQKNLAAEMLQKLLADEIKVYQRTNLVKSQLFSEKMEELMRRYRNSLITNAEVIEELLKMAGDIRQANEDGNALGLTNEEQAFYDAITKPENIKDFYSNDKLKEMTLKLTEELRKSRTIDWQLKDSARASMRSKIKRLLKKYKYPPEGQKKALEYVIRQAELMSDNISVYDMERPTKYIT
ncbi:MAG: type I restriction endonuclease subunit R [Candidatus Neomarinimicrobiota bacterium]